MGWGVFFVCLLVLAWIPLGIRVSYGEAGFEARIIAGPVKITLFPRKNRKKKLKTTDSSEKATEETTKSPSEKKRPKTETTEKDEPGMQSGGSLERFVPWIRLGLDFLGALRRKIRLDNLYLHVVLAGDDPCDLAVNYGRAWAAVGDLLPKLERIFVIRKRDIQVGCDFAAEKITVAARGDMTMTLGRTLCLGTIYGIRALKIFLTMKREGGAAA